MTARARRRIALSGLAAFAVAGCGAGTPTGNAEPLSPAPPARSEPTASSSFEPLQIIEPVLDEHGNVIGTRPMLNEDGSPRMTQDESREVAEGPPVNTADGCLFSDRTLCGADLDRAGLFKAPADRPSPDPSR